MKMITQNLNFHFNHLENTLQHSLRAPDGRGRWRHGIPRTPGLCFMHHLNTMQDILNQRHPALVIRKRVASLPLLCHQVEIEVCCVLRYKPTTLQQMKDKLLVEIRQGFMVDMEGEKPERDEHGKLVEKRRISSEDEGDHFLPFGEEWVRIEERQVSV